MTRLEIESEVLKLFEREFEIVAPGLNDDLREIHEFDSIDAIELLAEIEKILQFKLSQDQKKQAMGRIRTIRQICDYVESLALAGAQVP